MKERGIMKLEIQGRGVELSGDEVLFVFEMFVKGAVALLY